MILRLVLTLALMVFAMPVMAQEGGNATSIAREAFMIDFDTGTILLDKNSNQRMPTASMSKVMTMYMVFDALKKGQLTLDQTLPVSEKAWRMQGSKMFVELGAQISVENLIRGVIIQSGNDATIVLAEGIAGTEDEFAAMMNAKARELGMNNSNFKNASGWPDPDHYSTARDLATLAMAMIRDFPDYYKYYSEREFTWHNIHQMNRNPLLYRDLGVDGLKTGHTEEAGYGLMASGQRDGRRVVMVVSGLSSERERAQESARLMEWGLRSFENITLFKAGEVVEQADVVMGQKAFVGLVSNDDVIVTVPRAVKNDLKVAVTYKGPLIAPIRKGDEVATLRLDIPRVGIVEKKLYAAEDVPQLGLIAGTLTKAKMMIGLK
jgi:D-alanyl-D-alanine carboxypeptidase (penicillin-binding protein 5/6)